MTVNELRLRLAANTTIRFVPLTATVFKEVMGDFLKSDPRKMKVCLWITSLINPVIQQQQYATTPQYSERFYFTRSLENWIILPICHANVFLRVLVKLLETCQKLLFKCQAQPLVVEQQNTGSECSAE